MLIQESLLRRVDAFYIFALSKTKGKIAVSCSKESHLQIHRVLKFLMIYCLTRKLKILVLSYFTLNSMPRTSPQKSDAYTFFYIAATMSVGNGKPPIRKKYC